jgi:DNA-binding GntR family transcriptional regulator
MAALLLRRKLVLEVDRRGARLDERLHQLERVQRPAEARLSVGHDRREPLGRVVALGVRDLVGPQQRVIDPRLPSLSTKADEVARVVEDEIVSSAIPPGQVLRQEHVCERFRASRAPVREALGRLEALSLVIALPNRGARVRSISTAELREAFMIRAELEALATAQAAPRMTPADLVRLDTAGERFAELTLELRAQMRSGDLRDSSLVVGWMAANHAFHDVIYEVAALPRVEQLAKGARRSFIGEHVWSALASSTSCSLATTCNTVRSRGARGRQRGGCSHARARARALLRPPDGGRARPRSRHDKTP